MQKLWQKTLLLEKSMKKNAEKTVKTSKLSYTSYKNFIIYILYLPMKFFIYYHLDKYIILIA